MSLRKNIVKIEWSPNFAYAIGLIASDGNLSPDGRHVVFTSKDHEMVLNFQKCLKTNYNIGRKSSGINQEKKYYVVQIGDTNFYNFLTKIKIMPNKSKTLGEIKIPTHLFFDFLRGLFDGDGSFYSYWDPRWKSSFMFYLTFTSASPDHINWLKQQLSTRLKIKGHVSSAEKRSAQSLRYAKKESLIIIRKIYYSKNVVCLKRKRLKIEKTLAIIGERI